MDINIRLKIDSQDIMKILLNLVNSIQKMESNANGNSNNATLKKRKVISVVFYIFVIWKTRIYLKE
jgi:hypothetical protein